MAKESQDSVSETLHVNQKNLNEIVNLVEELVINKVRLEGLKSGISDVGQVKILDQELRVITDMQSAIKKVGLIKINTIYAQLENLVKQLNTEKTAEVAFQMDGQETEIENIIVNSLNKIYCGLISDLFDNGFQTAKTGFIKIDVSSDTKFINTVFACNGNGFLNGETINRTDLSEMKLDEAEAFLARINLTHTLAELIRLKTEMESAGGNIVFENNGNGLFQISFVIPVSSSIMQGMLINIGEQVFAIPTDFIDSIINTKIVKRQEACGQEVIVHMDQVMPLLNLSKLLEVETEEEPASIIIACVGSKRAALLVDTVIDQTDMVIKPKHPIMRDMREFRGTTILGDGQVTLVLDIPSIVTSA